MLHSNMTTEENIADLIKQCRMAAHAVAFQSVDKEADNIAALKVVRDELHSLDSRYPKG